MPEKSFSHKELVELLGKLKEETPEYPAKLVDARKESFLKHVLDMSTSGGGQGGDGGSDGGDEGPKGGSAGSGAASGPGKAGKPAAPTSPSNTGGSSRPTSGLSGSGGKGGSGAGLSGGTTFLGFSLKSVLVFGAVVVLLTAAYLFRDQIVEYLAENGITSAEETTAPPFESSRSGQETEIPPGIAASESEELSPEIAATATAPGLGNADNGNSPGMGGNTNPTQKPPGQTVGSATATPTPEPPGDLGSAMRFLICILRLGGESCR